jgi:hypothetical protein
MMDIYENQITVEVDWSLTRNLVLSGEYGSGAYGTGELNLFWEHRF